MKRKLPSAAAMLLVLISAGGAGPALSEPATGGEQDLADVRVRYDWEDVQLVIVATKIAEILERAILLDVSAQSDQVTFAMSESLPPKEAARFILDVLRGQGYRIYEEPEYIGIMKGRHRPRENAP